MEMPMKGSTYQAAKPTINVDNSVEKNASISTCQR